MATITPTSIGGSGVKTVTETTMTASDTLTYIPGSAALSRTYPEGGTGIKASLLNPA